MILNSEEIKKLNIIEDFDEKKLGNASYDLSIDKIITMDGKEREKNYKIHSQEMIWVICKEKFEMPKNIIGFAYVKTRLTREGILAMNTGIIDPNYKGKISTLLINFGNGKKTISQNDALLRVTFAKVNEQNSNFPSIIEEDDVYLKKIIKSTDNFDSTFLNVRTIKEQWYRLLKNKLGNLFLIMAAIVTCVLALISVVQIAITIMNE